MIQVNESIKELFTLTLHIFPQILGGELHEINYSDENMAVLSSPGVLGARYTCMGLLMVVLAAHFFLRKKDCTG